MQRRFIGAHAGVAADELQLADRDVQHSLVGVFQVQKLLQRRASIGLDLPHAHIDQPAVTANAVRGMHHWVAQLEFAEVFNKCFDVTDLFLLFTSSCGGACGKKLGFRHQI